ncbi:MAG TPA: hypothetical protein VFQ53_02545 [Kofleriaceae bacterium]|nr:hypothetical protein [Kofleriaceae bacterium]
MKKLVIAFATLALAATPVLACPGHEEATTDQAPKTAEKDKSDAKAPKTTEKAKAAPVKKATDTKTAKPEPKKDAPKTDKVSSR